MHITARILISTAVLALAGCTPAAETASEAGDAAPAASATSEDTGEVVARIGEREIRLSELTEWIKDDFYRREVAEAAEGRRYERHSEALDRMIDESLLEAAAASQGVDVDTLIEKAGEDVPQPSDEELRAFFDENQDRIREPYEEVVDRIREFMTARAAEEARSAFVTGLRESAGVEIALAPPRIPVATTGASKGAADAPVTIVEFSDYQCPFCQRAEPVVDEVLAKYPDQVRFVYKHFPLDSIHPRARPASEAAECAEEQDSFWEYHAKLFGGGGLEVADLERYAAEVGLDVAAFKACVAERKFQDEVEADVTAGREAGVTGTPAFFINGIPLAGARDVGEFSRWIDQELAN